MITSATNGRIKWVVSLMEKARMRRKEQKYVAEGIRMLLEAPKEAIAEVYVSETFMKRAGEKDSQEAGCMQHIKASGAEILDVSDDVFRKLSDTVNPQGILAVMRMAESSPEEMLNGNQTPLFMILENLQDPGNLGTVLRTAEGAGCSGIILSRDCVDLYNPKVIRSTMGAVFRVPFFYTDNLMETIADLRQRGVRIYAAALDEQAAAYDTYSYEHATAFLVGNEGNGLTKEAIAAAGQTCYIPMEGKVESLNASVAAAILMYEAYRQRRIRKV